MFPVSAGAAQLRVLAVADAEDPDPAERIPEHRAPVSARCTTRDFRSPVNTVRREEQLLRRHVAVGEHQLEAACRIFLFLIQPEGRGASPLIMHDVGPGLNVERRLLPMDAVSRGRVSDVLPHPSSVPQLEDLVLGIEPDAVAKDGNGGNGSEDLEDTTLVLVFPGFVGLQNRIFGTILRPVVGTRQSRLLDEKIIDEQLASHVDGDHGRRAHQVLGIRRRRAAQPLYLWRPGVRKSDAIIEQLSGRTHFSAQ